MQQQATQSETVSKKRKKVLHAAVTVVVAAAIFGVGWMTGSGRLSVQNYQTVSSNSSLPAKLDYSSVDTVYQSLRQNFDGELSEAELLDGLKAGLAKATGDPYTEYLNPKAAGEFTKSLEGTFEGIGAQLGKDGSNVIIVSPISGYPAEKAGLQPKDVIAAINDESAYDLSVNEAVEKIRGEKGTSVKLTIARDGELKEFSIVREEINIPSVETEIRDGIGIMKISQFGDDTVRLAQEAAAEFKAANVRGIVLDLRSNPGGYLDGAVDVSSLWLDSNTPVLTERRDNVVIKTIRSRGTAVLKGIPTVVLINEGSASASEITAGALKDNGVATLLGQKSFGKGSVQQPVSLGNGGILKVTIARWFTPEGKNIDKEGISPDEKVEISSEDITTGRDPQLDAALSSLRR